MFSANLDSKNKICKSKSPGAAQHHAPGIGAGENRPKTCRPAPLSFLFCVREACVCLFCKLSDETGDGPMKPDHFRLKAIKNFMGQVRLLDFLPAPTPSFSDKISEVALGRKGAEKGPDPEAAIGRGETGKKNTMSEGTSTRNLATSRRRNLIRTLIRKITLKKQRF